jgi:hypothetical protein
MALLDIGANRSQYRKAIEISHVTGVSAWACSGVAGQLIDILPACEGENGGLRRLRYMGNTHGMFSVVTYHEELPG